MFAGFADSTLSRDEDTASWYSAAPGRVDDGATAAAVPGGDSASSPTWVSVLRAAGAHDTYLRTHTAVSGRQPGRRVHVARPAVPAVGVLAQARRHSLDELMQVH